MEGTPVRMLGRVGRLAEAARPVLPPELRINYGPPPPTSPAFPQNTLRATLQNGIRHAARTAGMPSKMLGAAANGERPLAPGEGIPGQPPADQLGPTSVIPSAADDSLPLGPAWVTVGMVAGAASAFHGYRRNKSVGWALWWYAMGALFPPITIAVGLAQGWGERKRG